MKNSARQRNSGQSHKVLVVVAGMLVAALVLISLLLGLMRPRRNATQPTQIKHGDFDQDALSVMSSARDAGEKKEPGSGGEAKDVRAFQAGKQKEAAAQQQQVVAMQAELDAKKRELEQQAQEQAAKELQIEQEQAQAAQERQRAEQATAEAERQRGAAAAEADRQRREAAELRPRPPAYNGPSSGNIVWQGEVQGATLVTINGNLSDTGQVMSGGLPGVLVMVQPADAKRVVVAGAPAPSNGYRRLMLRIQGRGMMQETIHWSIP